MTLNDQEKRELDAWLAEHVMEVQILSEVQMVNHAAGVLKYQPECGVFCIGQSRYKAIRSQEGEIKCEQMFNHYSGDNHYAFEVLKRCAEKAQAEVQIWKYPGHEIQWGCKSEFENIDIEAETLELAICLFARKLFEKGAVEAGPRPA